jgi:hypothetical protein
MKFFLLCLILVLVSACSIVESKVAGLVSNDLQRTAELASKYGQPSIANCANYLNSAINGHQELAKEDTSGVISYALRSYLHSRLTDGNEEAFKQNCGPFAAGLMLHMGKNIAR